MSQERILKDGRVLHICRPRGEDAARMLDYIKTIGGETDFLLFGAEGLPYAVEQEAKILESFGEEKRGGFFIGCIDGEIACSFSLACAKRERMAHVAEIALTVRKKYWGIGVGSVMMETLIAMAREADIRTIELGVYADNTRARRLYGRFGFVEVGKHTGRFCVNGKYHDEIMMDLYLQNGGEKWEK